MHGQMNMQTRDSRISDVGKITSTHYEAHILEPRFAQGYSVFDRPDSAWQFRLDCAPADRAPPQTEPHLTAEDGGRDWGAGPVIVLIRAVARLPLVSRATAA
nr:hypothetical protein GCM10017611_13200 [Rhodococcus wratislaviensis]